jgi:hypothetical protein
MDRKSGVGGVEVDKSGGGPWSEWHITGFDSSQLPQLQLNFAYQLSDYCCHPDLVT